MSVVGSDGKIYLNGQPLGKIDSWTMNGESDEFDKKDYVLSGDISGELSGTCKIHRRRINNIFSKLKKPIPVTFNGGNCSYTGYMSLSWWQRSAIRFGLYKLIRKPIRITMKGHGKLERKEEK